MIVSRTSNTTEVAYISDASIGLFQRKKFNITSDYFVFSQEEVKLIK